MTKAALGDADVARLEALIDRLETELPPLRRFILAGGSPAGAALHVARTVCRRAERRIVALDAAGRSACSIRYVNRLSDLLFVLARVVNHRARRRRKPSGELRVPDQRQRSRRLDIALDRVEDRARQLLRHALADRSALDERSCRVTRLDRDVPAIARDAFGPIVEAGRVLARASRASGATSHAAIGEPLMSTRTAAIEILVDRPVAVVEVRRVFGEEHEVVVRRDLGDDACGRARARESRARWRRRR